MECNVDIQWESCEDIMPINLYITSHTVPMEIANPLDWSFDVQSPKSLKNEMLIFGLHSTSEDRPSYLSN